MIATLAHVVVGVADLAPVRALWVEQFGLEVVAERQGHDPALAALWGLSANTVAGQLLLRTPGASCGWLHFVQFAEPGAPVRRGASTTDLCPKNIDVICTDLPARRDDLLAAGYTFRSAINEYTIGDVTACEVQMPAHDDTNVVLIEVYDMAVDLSARGFAAVTSFVLTVPNTEPEAHFFSDLFGHKLLLQHNISGPAIEAVVGLPPGSMLEMKLLGDPAEALGRVELIAYVGATGENLYPRARPPATGVLALRFAVADLSAWRARAEQSNTKVEVHGELQTVFGSAHMLSCRSPAGCRIEVFQHN